jgi:glycosyltransferase involved in cell wall biosynthesis
MFPAVFLRCYRNSIWSSALYAFSIGTHRKFGTFNLISGFIVLNPFTAKKLTESHLVTEDKIKVIPNFLSTEPTIRRGSKRPAEAIFLGRLSQEKGVQFLLEAMKQLPKLFLHILGTGPMEDELKLLAKDTKRNITFEGFVTGKKKVEFLQRATMMILPSLSYEQFPITALEGMSAATPLVAPNMGGWSSIVRDGKTGLLYEPANIEDLVGKIQFLLNNPKLGKLMGINGKRLIKDYFSADFHYRNLMNIYESILKNRANT